VEGEDKRRERIQSWWEAKGKRSRWARKASWVRCTVYKLQESPGEGCVEFLARVETVDGRRQRRRRHGFRRRELRWMANGRGDKGSRYYVSMVPLRFFLCSCSPASLFMNL
jgi:uncharacterized protein YchJ